MNVIKYYSARPYYYFIKSQALCTLIFHVKTIFFFRFSSLDFFFYIIIIHYTIAIIIILIERTLFPLRYAYFFHCHPYTEPNHL